MSVLDDLIRLATSWPSLIALPMHRRHDGRAFAVLLCASSLFSQTFIIQRRPLSFGRGIRHARATGCHSDSCVCRNAGSGGILPSPWLRCRWRRPRVWAGRVSRGVAACAVAGGDAAVLSRGEHEFWLDCPSGKDPILHVAANVAEGPLGTARPDERAKL